MKIPIALILFTVLISNNCIGSSAQGKAEENQDNVPSKGKQTTRKEKPKVEVAKGLSRSRSFKKEAPSEVLSSDQETVQAQTPKKRQRNKKIEELSGSKTTKKAPTSRKTKGKAKAESSSALIPEDYDPELIYNTNLVHAGVSLHEPHSPSLDLAPSKQNTPLWLKKLVTEQRLDPSLLPLEYHLNNFEGSHYQLHPETSSSHPPLNFEQFSHLHIDPHHQEVLTAQHHPAIYQPIHVDSGSHYGEPRLAPTEFNYNHQIQGSHINQMHDNYIEQLQHDNNYQLQHDYSHHLQQDYSHQIPQGHGGHIPDNVFDDHHLDAFLKGTEHNYPHTEHAFSAHQIPDDLHEHDYSYLFHSKDGPGHVFGDPELPLDSPKTGFHG